MTRRFGADYDVIVVGTGVAGLSVALPLAATRRVAVITSSELGGGSTAMAQGGIAGAIDATDSPRLHAADTTTAGAGLCDAEAVRRLTEDAPARIAELAGTGADFDHDGAGDLALTREGGHHRSRVVHAGGDATGAEVSRALVAAIRAAAVTVIEHTTVTDLQVGISRFGKQVSGVVVRRDEAGEDQVITAHEVVLATGGIGGLYAASTNPVEVTGEGLALALRASAVLADLEFVQFHPTGLRVAGEERVPLISEALRGEGAILRDRNGVAIMAGHHDLADLAPRDIVARRIADVMTETVDGTPNLVGLDASGLAAELPERFPTAYSICRAHGIDPAAELIPVTPTQHFMCGGIQTDTWGRTSVRGLSAVGEAAATGLHGANRLASNSLVEGLAFGRRVAERLARELSIGLTATAAILPPLPVVAVDSLGELRAVMSRRVGVVRSPAGLAAAGSGLDALADASGATGTVWAGLRWLTARAIVIAATERRESRGCHWRSDYPRPNEAWRHRLLVSLDDDGELDVTAALPLDRSA
jgi:L-aspartate oxidase